MSLLSMTFQIEIKDFKKQYKDTCVEIKQLVIDSRVSVLLGINGSGKSTILKGIAGLISFHGSIKQSHPSFSYMSENPVYPLDCTVGEFLQYLYYLQNKHDSVEIIDDLLKQFHLEHKKDAYIHQLSKGMKAKVNAIQCLMMESDVYILDEPLSGLDKEGIHSLIDYIKDSSKAFIISTHSMTEFQTLKPQVIIL